jgi:hypothetical protein
MMGDIYSGAKLVLVWLGLERENSAEVFAYLYRNRIPDFDINQDLTILKPEFLESLVGDEIIREGLASLLNRRYWMRLWIVQEFFFGRRLEIHCGWDNIDGTLFLNFLEWIWWVRMAGSFDKTLKRLRATPGMKIASQRLMRMEGKSHGLWKFLSDCKDSQSSDPLDKIYALIPLADDVPKDGIQIDYSLTLYELKIRVALPYIVKTGCYLEHLLRFCRLLDRMVCSPDGEEQSHAIEPIFSTRDNMIAELRRVLDDRDHVHYFTLEADRRFDQNDGILSPLKL